MSNIYRRGEDSDIAWLPVNIPVYRADGYGMTTGSISPHRTRTRHTGDPHTRGVFHTRAIPYKYFPPPGTPPPLQPQNYTTILYWLGWADMKRDKPRDVVDAVRTRYLTLFNQFAWVPKPHNDRLRNHFQTWPGARIPSWDPANIPGEIHLEEDEHEHEYEDDPQHPDYVPAAQLVSNVRPVPLRILQMREEEEEFESDAE
ncbi:hypothetical protein BD769DRAFT_1683327 [Suillus cothurnatus]|nr:hypothetical protein BD769DRAFT_1683327 [Suillus cothurnatus]